MRRLWNCSKLNDSFPPDVPAGLRLRFDVGVDPEVRGSYMRFARWLRKEYVFPRRIFVHLCDSETVISRGGMQVASLFWGPYNKKEAPYIRIATGDYQEMIASIGKYNALTTDLHSMTLQLSYYFQWIQDLPESAQQARYYAENVLLDYLDQTERL